MGSTVTELLRRRFMGGKKEDGYIKDGLVFHLDGIDKGTTDTTKWVDLVGGIEFTEQSGVSTWQDTYMEFNRDRWYKGDVLPNFPFSTHTIEVCGNFRQDWQGYLLMGNKMIGLGRDVRGNAFVGLGNNCSFTVPNKSFYENTIYSANGQVYMVNGLGDVISGTVSRAGNFSKPVIGSLMENQLNYGLRGRLYSIRVYSRYLTTDEMLHNQRVDNERFELGLTI